MKRLLSRRPSPAMIVALLALFVALSGSSYAAVKIGARDIQRGAVGTRAIANNSIRSGDIRNATVSGADVKDDSLTNADIDNTNLSAKTAETRGPGHHGHEREHGEQRDERGQRRQARRARFHGLHAPDVHEPDGCAEGSRHHRRQPGVLGHLHRGLRLQLQRAVDRGQAPEHGPLRGPLQRVTGHPGSGDGDRDRRSRPTWSP